MDEDIVHAGRNTWNNMNKARVAEAALGSPPFYFEASEKLGSCHFGGMTSRFRT